MANFNFERENQALGNFIPSAPNNDQLYEWHKVPKFILDLDVHITTNF